eukprot:scaffold12636_cov94-Phaeocystis_antarctica.AAC.1
MRGVQSRRSRRLLEEPRLAILYVHRLARACGCWPRVLRLLVFAARRTSSALVGEHCLVLAIFSARTENRLGHLETGTWATHRTTCLSGVSPTG